MEKLLRNGFMRALLLVMLAGVAGQTAYGMFGGESYPEYSDEESSYARPVYSEAQIQEVLGHIATAEKAKKSDLRKLPGALYTLAMKVNETLKYREYDDSGEPTSGSLRKLETTVRAFANSMSKAIKGNPKVFTEEIRDSSLRTLKSVWDRTGRALGYEAAPSEPVSPTRNEREARAAAVARDRETYSDATGSFYDRKHANEMRLDKAYQDRRQAAAAAPRSPDRFSVRSLSSRPMLESDDDEASVLPVLPGSVATSYDASPAAVAGLGLFPALDAIYNKYNAKPATVKNYQDMKDELKALRDNQELIAPQAAIRAVDNYRTNFLALARKLGAGDKDTSVSGFINAILPTKIQ